MTSPEPTIRRPGDLRVGGLGAFLPALVSTSPPMRRNRFRLPRAHPVRRNGIGDRDAAFVVDVSGSTGTTDPAGARWYGLADLAVYLHRRRRDNSVTIITFDTTATVAVAPTRPRDAAPLIEELARQPLGGGTAFGPPAQLAMDATGVGAAIVWFTDLGALLPCPELSQIAMKRPCGLVVLSPGVTSGEQARADATSRGWPDMPTIAVNTLDDPQTVGMATADLLHKLVRPRTDLAADQATAVAAQP